MKAMARNFFALPIFIALFAFQAMPQIPQEFNYQAVIRDAAGDAIPNKDILVRISLSDNQEGTSPYYTETHTAQTNLLGTFGLQVGAGTTTDDFSAIPWSTGNIWVKVEVDESLTGSNYVLSGSTRLCSVPYALYTLNGVPGPQGPKGDKGDTGNGIASIVDNGNGTFTYNYTDGGSFTTSDLTGPVGPAGLEVPGADGQTLVHNGTSWAANSAITVKSDTVGIGVSAPISKLIVQGETTALPEDPIFEVKNKDGKVVLGVYNEGVRIYVADGITKGAKGGFAVGGLTNQTKGNNIEYLRITPDSARIYIRDTVLVKGAKGGFAVGGLTNQTKGVTDNYLYVHRDSSRIYIKDTDTKGAKGGFAVGGLTNQTKSGNTSYFNIETQSNNIIKPSEARILWHPKKNAFLTGQVLIEHPDSVGTNSFASGFESQAKGNWSQSLGFKTNARGDYSTAIGKNALASGESSFAFGDGSKSIGTSSFSFGTGAIAQGIGSYAIGSIVRDTLGIATGNYTSATGSYSIAMGQGSISSGFESMSFGVDNTASGKFSVAIGNKASATGPYSMALGCDYYRPMVGAGSVIGSTASGDGSLAMNGANASGDNSIAIGRYAVAQSKSSIAIGSEIPLNYCSNCYPTQAIGSFSCALGVAAVSKGWGSFAIGNDVISRSTGGFVIGRCNDTLQTLADEELFIVANGISYSDMHGWTLVRNPSNALTMLKNGNLGLGIKPLYLLHLKGGAYSDGQTWVNSSDRNLKENFTDVNGQEILAKINELKIQSWNYIDDSEKVKHIGPVAQEFFQIFRLGNNDKSISTIDSDGISLAAIKELAIQNQKQQLQIQSLEQRNAELEAKTKEIDNLKAELEEIKAMMKK